MLAGMKHLSALQALTASCCNELVRLKGPTDVEAYNLRLRRFHTLRSLKWSGSLTRSSHLQMLPSQVIGNIAFHLDLIDRIHLTQICSSLRAVLLSNAGLWSRLGLESPSRWQPHQTTAAGANNMLYRANSGTITLSISDNVETIVSVLSEHLARLRSLHIQLNPPDRAPAGGFRRRQTDSELASKALIDDWRTLSAMLDLKPVVSLERLDIRLIAWGIRPRTLPRFRLPPGLFEGRIGNLHSLSLCDISLSNKPCPALSTLTSFSYSSRQFQHSKLLAAELELILNTMPLLENLSLAFRDFDDQGRTLIPRTTLSPFRVVLEEFADKMVFLAVYFANFATEVVMIQANEPIPNLEAAWEAQHHRHFSLCLSLFTSTIRTIPNARNLLKEEEAHRQSHQPQTTMTLHAYLTPLTAQHFGKLDTPELAQYITRITVHEFQWDKLVELGTLPGLDELTIILATCHDYWARMHSYYGQFTVRDPTQRPHSTRFPALSVTRIYSAASWWDPDYDARVCGASLYLRYTGQDPESKVPCCCRNNITLSLGELAEALVDVVGAARQLDTLVIGGIAAFIDLDPAPGLKALESIAANIEFVSQPPREVIEESRVDFYHLAGAGLHYFDFPLGGSRESFVSNRLPAAKASAYWSHI